MLILSSATIVAIITPSDKRLAMKQYKGVIFNSTTVRCLRVPLEEAVRNAVSVATDADTIAAIAGALAAATPGMEIPKAWADRVFGMLKPDLKAILVDFDERFCQD